MTAGTKFGDNHDRGCPGCADGTVLDICARADCGHSDSPSTFHWIYGKSFCSRCALSIPSEASA